MSTRYFGAGPGYYLYWHAPNGEPYEEYVKAPDVKTREEADRAAREQGADGALWLSEDRAPRVSSEIIEAKLLAAKLRKMTDEEIKAYAENVGLDIRIRPEGFDVELLAQHIIEWQRLTSHKNAPKH